MPKAETPRRSVRTDSPLPFTIRRSRVHGHGAFATRDIERGEVIAEYIGERISHAEANRRVAHLDETDAHTFFFTVDSRTVIDGGVGGNGSRFINHHCEPNCEARVRRRRVFIVATRRIRKGEELGIEYNIGREADDPENVDEIYACRCGSPRCRGTILWPPKRSEPRRTSIARRRRIAANVTVART